MIGQWRSLCGVHCGETDDIIIIRPILFSIELFFNFNKSSSLIPENMIRFRRHFLETALCCSEESARHVTSRTSGSRPGC